MPIRRCMTAGLCAPAGLGPALKRGKPAAAAGGADRPPPVLPRRQDEGRAAEDRSSANAPGRSTKAISRSAIAARRCSFPSTARKSYLAAARMGAGMIECDVTFTKDRQLVCRHSQCDLHTTTNILSVPALAAKCSQPFSARPIPRPARRRRQSAAPATSRSPNSSSSRPRWTASIPMRRRRRVSERHAALAHRPLRQFRHADDA